MANPQTFSDLLASGYREAVVVLSKDLKILGANQTFLSEKNLELDEIKGKACHEVLGSCMNFCKEQTDECPVYEALSTGKPVSVTHQDVMLDSVPHHFKIDIYPVTDERSGEMHFLHIARDITNRIEEERLKDNMWMEILNRMEHLYASMVEGNENIEHIQGDIDQLVEIVPLAVVGWDLQGRINRWNSNAEIMFGHSATEVLGKPFIEFFASGRSQEKFSEIMQMLKMGQSEIYALAENRTTSGRIIFCEWHHSVYQYDDSGEMTSCLSLGQDVTERKKTEKELARVTGQIGAILNATGDALVGVNNLRRINLWNPAAEKLFGWLASEVTGREMEMLFPVDLQREMNGKFRHFLEGDKSAKGRKTTFETAVIRRDSITVPVEVTLSSSLIEDKPNCFAIFHEITERKRTETILVQSEKMRSLGEMANGVAHDFNNCLTIILGNIKLLKENSGDREIREKLNAIESAARQGATSIASLQMFSTDTEATHKHTELLALKPLIEEVRNLTRFRWKDLPQKDGYTIEFTTDTDNAPALLVDGPDFKEMLTNLIFNAVDAMPSGGHIHVSAGQDEESVVITVQDNGNGISKEQAEHIFEPYYTTKGRGHAGLGLSIAKRFVERHGGLISVESVRGAGTTFHISFPLLTTSDPQKLLQQQNIDRQPSRKILLIDDDPLVRNLLKQVLEKAGHQVTEAENGQEGVRRFRENVFDLVITDHGMPVMNGLDAAFRIKKQNPGTPVILISGWQTRTDTTFQKPSGIDEFVTKPFDLEELIRLVAKYGSREAG